LKIDNICILKGFYSIKGYPDNKKRSFKLIWQLNVTTASELHIELQDWLYFAVVSNHPVAENSTKFD